MNPPDDTDRAVRTAIVLLFALVVVRDAWVGDDAYITLRTVDHWVNGRGLGWNLGERVQAYTHPLWMLVLAAIYAFTREGFWTLLLPSVACSIAAAALFARWLVPAGPAGWAVLGLLPLSRAFVDYSTSGLENPLTHLILVGALAVWFRGEAGMGMLGRLSLLLGLAMTNRMDTVLLIGPLVAGAAVDARRGGASFATIAGRIGLGLSPFFAWEAFSLVYYGALVPNTALAKLNTGIPRGELFHQGLYYLLDSVERDPITLLVVAAGVLSATRSACPAVPALGAALYVLYVVRIGGDFMTGRFLAAPFLVAVACLGHRSWSNQAAGVGAVIALFVSFAANVPTLAPVTGPPPEERVLPDERGIADERSYYAFDGNGLSAAARWKSMPAHPWRGSGERLPKARLALVQAAGVRGWASAPTVHFVDTLALGEPVLARLPAKYDPKWRVGHYERAVPEGYLETLQDRKDHLDDPQLEALFGAVRTVVRGPIWSRERLRAIVGLHLGRYPIDVDRYRFAGATVVDPGSPDDPIETSLLRPDLVQLGTTGAYVDVDGPASVPFLFVRRRSDLDLSVRFYRDEVLVGEADLPRSVPNGEFLSGDYVDVPASAVEAGYDVVRIVPVAGPEPWLFLSVELAPRRVSREATSAGLEILPAGGRR